MNDQSTREPKPRNPELSEGARTLVTLLLFVHLFALAITVLAHAGPSELTNQIRERVPLLQPYMRRLWMDHAYTYSDYVNPRQDVRLDTQYALEVEYEYSDGTTRRIELPDRTVGIATRRRRYQTLARNLAAVVGDDREAEYASMVAGGLLAEDPSAVSLRLACVERFTPSIGDDPPDVPSAVRGDGGVYSVKIYRCQAWINEEDGEVEIRKEEERRRLAPVTKATPEA
jgi:hypothetical protein